MQSPNAVCREVDFLVMVTNSTRGDAIADSLGLRSFPFRCSGGISMATTTVGSSRTATQSLSDPQSNLVYSNTLSIQGENFALLSPMSNNTAEKECYEESLVASVIYQRQQSRTHVDASHRQKLSSMRREQPSGWAIGGTQRNSGRDARPHGVMVHPLAAPDNAKMTAAHPAGE
jgi:hypothetical protein